MSHAKQLQSGFVLHTRPWRETSLLVDIFTENYGKIGLCARGVRGKKSLQRSLLQPLSPLLLSWTGRGELQTLTSLEPAAPAIILSGNALYCALYINELMVRLLHKHDPHPELFYHYHRTLERLSVADNLEQVLREFELLLLTNIGYGLTLSNDINGAAITESDCYQLNADGLFQMVENLINPETPRQFYGAHLLLIAEKNWQDLATLKTAKRLLRLALQPLLGEKPLQSRKLFRRDIS